MALEIYKASAGSGKTFQIVREYLKMAFKRPGAYKSILAITFTNKATAEMKDRILQELSILAAGKPSAHLHFLSSELNLDEQEIRRTADKVLKLILHDYSRFSISTIDSLFQRVIRAFSREMHLHPNYRTEIETKEILEEAVNQLFLEIDQNEELRNWMLGYTEENIKEGKRWNLTEELIRKGAELFTEDFKQFSSILLDKLSDKTFLSKYSLRLKEIVGQYEQTLKSIGNKALKLLGEHLLTTDQFRYGSTSFARHFDKISNGNFEMPGKRVLDACDNRECWYKASDNAELKNKIQEVYDAGLNDLLVSSVQYMETESINANSAKVILSNLFSFGLLTDIAGKVSKISRERNLILLNDSTRILKRAINGNDSPFVYEKLGSVYKHYMLDEFQDTSNLQWQNLKSLVENSLAEGNKNIVVGDVKQSIYRWRNGDWNLLACQLGKDFSNFEIREISLSVNWRSSKNIIGFNNIIFRESAKYLNSDFESAFSKSVNNSEEMAGIISTLYAENYQKFSERTSKEGYIRIKFIEQEKTQKKKEYREKVLIDFITQIEAVQNSGVRPGEIAVLVRNKNEGALVADALLDRKISYPDSPCCYDFISNDTLIIGQSPVVKFILNLFSLLVNQENDIVKANLIYSYDHIISPQIEPGNESLHDSFDIHHHTAERFKSWMGGNEVPLNEELLSLPLFNLAIRITDEFGLGKITGELLYLDAFLDLILQYSKKEAGGIPHFLDWWELTGKDKTISLSEGQDAITILTIHKSKGLEFRSVFIPFCDWETVPCFNKVPYLWCHPENEPFNQLDLVLVKYSRQLEQSIFAKNYHKEMLYSMVDNLNLLYVAFTRAINSMYITCPYTSNLNDSSKDVGSLIQRIVENPPLLDSLDKEKYIDLASCWDSEARIFEFGTLQKVLYPESKKITYQKELSNLRISGKKEGFRVRDHRQEYFMIGGNELSQKLNYGRLLHELFENISTVTDISRSIKRMVSEGKIDSTTAKEYESIVQRMLADEPVKDWFSGDWKVLNERNILRGADHRHRPDRIMIKDHQVILVDYKTGEKHDSHVSQVKGYLKDFQKMGNSETKGYLWYLNDNELIEVRL